MREIKFRALYRNIETSETKYFYYGIGVITVIGYVKIYDDEQFTGLHDKSGQEIYEGDILNGSTGVPLVMAFDDKEGIFLACNKFSYISNDMIQNHEIIGNIHENPELLK
jgi:hypothetical protein